MYALDRARKALAGNYIPMPAYLYPTCIAASASGSCNG